MLMLYPRNAFRWQSPPLQHDGRPLRSGVPVVTSFRTVVGLLPVAGSEKTLTRIQADGSLLVEYSAEEMTRLVGPRVGEALHLVIRIGQAQELAEPCLVQAFRRAGS